MRPQLILLCTIISTVRALELSSVPYESYPKIYVDVHMIDAVEPIANGFQIQLSKSFVNFYLDPQTIPTVYLTITPLRYGKPTRMEVVYLENIADYKLLVNDLSLSTWYYICLEFVNYDPYITSGYTGTNCKIARTMDHFGFSASSTITKIRKAWMTSDAVEHVLKVNGDFPLVLTAYLEDYPKQKRVFTIREAQSLKILFSGLKEIYKDQKLCTVEVSLRNAYTALGHRITAPIFSCTTVNLSSTYSISPLNSVNVLANSGKDSYGKNLSFPIVLAVMVLYTIY